MGKVKVKAVSAARLRCVSVGEPGPGSVVGALRGHVGGSGGCLKKGLDYDYVGGEVNSRKPASSGIFGVVDQQRYASVSQYPAVSSSTQGEDEWMGKEKENEEEKRSQPKMMAEVRERREEKVGNERTPALLSSTMQAG